MPLSCRVCWLRPIHLIQVGELGQRSNCLMTTRPTILDIWSSETESNRLDGGRIDRITKFWPAIRIGGRWFVVLLFSGRERRRRQSALTHGAWPMRRVRPAAILDVAPSRNDDEGRKWAMNGDNAIVESGAERKWLAVDAAARFYLRAVGETSAAADLTDSRVFCCREQEQSGRLRLLIGLSQRQRSRRRIPLTNLNKFTI